MNSDNITLKIFKINSCSSCTNFTIKTYGKLKEKLFNENIIDQIEIIIINQSNINFYKNLYNLDSNDGVPLLMIEKYTKGNMIYDKYKGKWSKISEILNWINEFLTKKIPIQNE